LVTALFPEQMNHTYFGGNKLAVSKARGTAKQRELESLAAGASAAAAAAAAAAGKADLKADAALDAPEAEMGRTIVQYDDFFV
jgi:hypothetical protein